MATDSPPTNLLGKLTRFFQDSEEQLPETLHARLAKPAAQGEASLKAMLKAKRRNDAIRKRELDQLRAIIRAGREFRPGDAMEVHFVTSTIVGGGLLGSAERRSILEKIDGAETDLAQWWGDPNAPVNAAPPRIAKAQSPSVTTEDLDLDFMEMLAETESQPEPAPAATNDKPATATQPLALRDPQEEEESPLDSCLREAALHYAQGAFADAEKLITDMQVEPGIAPAAAELLTFSLFEVYRCMGQQDRFDALALDYANRFGRSPAEWFSVPELVEPTRASADAQSAGHAPGDKYWSCPAILDAAALADAIARHADRQADSYINWQPLQHIDSSIAPAFAGQLNAWCGQSITLHWLGTDGLLAALQMCKVGGNPAADAAWWLIHLDMLCLLQERERFEEMALSYCTGFELSPPDWRPVACTLVQDDAFASSLALGAGPHSVHPDHAATSQNPYASYALSGNLTGHPTQTLTELAHEAATAAELTVSCQRLGRVDAEAACALMNWAAQCRTSGCAVRFVHLPRLVMVFFELIGMQQVARLSIGAH